VAKATEIFTPHGRRALLLYPVVSAALVAGLLWPWRAALPRALLRSLAGSDERRALEMAELRLRIRRVWMRTMPGRRRLSPLLIPFTTPIRSWRARKHPAPAASLAAWGLSLLPALRYAPRSRVCFAHEWYRAEHGLRASMYLDGRLRNDALQMLRCLGDPGCRWSEPHLNKLEFFRRCEGAGLPSIPVLAAFKDGRVEEVAQDPLDSGRDLFVKPAEGVSGRGLYQLWRRVGDTDGFQSAGERVLTFSELRSSLQLLSRQGPELILQPRLHNHPEIAEITRSQALCCVRVITCRFPDGEVVIDPGWCVLKVAARDAVVDNVAGGDALRYVAELASGALSSVAGQPVRSASTGGQARVPFWEEAKELCRRAHGGPFRAMAAVAWDVGIVRNGPVLVEGNVTYLGPGTLSTTGPYCGYGPVGRCLLQHFRRIDRDDLRRLRASCAG